MVHTHCTGTKTKFQIPDTRVEKKITDVHSNPDRLIMESCDVLFSDIEAR